MKHIVFRNGDLILDRTTYVLVNFWNNWIRPNILALTATADDQVLQDIIHYLCLESPAIHKHSLDRKEHFIFDETNELRT